MIQRLFTNQKGCYLCVDSAIITDFETGEILCSKCGLVLSDRVEDSGPEWRNLSNDKIDRRRTGDGTSLAKHDHGLSTIISSTNKDATGKALSISMKKNLKQLRVQDIRSKIHAATDKNLIQAFNELSRLKDKLALTNAIMEKTAYIYRKAIERKLVRGRTISAMIAASLYAACRDTETPRTLKDVGQASNIKRKDIARCYRLLLRELNLRMPVVDPVKCISRIASKAGLSEKTKRKATKILQTAEELKISAGKDPMGLAAAALYVACVTNGENKTQRDVAEAAGVTEVTIRNRYKGLKVALNL